jgi:hypothetical protein
MCRLIIGLRVDPGRTVSPFRAPCSPLFCFRTGIACRFLNVVQGAEWRSVGRAMVDDPEIRRVAAEHIRMQGPAAVAWLTEQAELAEASGDAEAAKTRREIAAAAARILRGKTERMT